MSLEYFMNNLIVHFFLARGSGSEFLLYRCFKNFHQHCVCDANLYSKLSNACVHAIKALDKLVPACIIWQLPTTCGSHLYIQTFKKYMCIIFIFVVFQCRIDYKQCYSAHRQSPSQHTLQQFTDAHNAYVQQLHATNAMLEAYHCDTLPQLMQELEEIYTDLCNTMADTILQGADAVSAKVSTFVQHKTI